MSGSISIIVAYSVFALFTISLFFCLPARIAAATAYMLGWLVLPVAVFPLETFEPNYFTINVIGAALPSNLGITKAAIIPAAILFGGLLRGGGEWRQWQPIWLDGAVLAFCLCPMVQWSLGIASLSNAAFNTAYVTIVWGGSWLIGRMFLSDADGPKSLVDSIAWSGLFLIPVALVETVVGPVLYRELYGDHAFRLEGTVRHVGFRPLGFFEHGTQYGFWIAMAALAWVAIVRRSDHPKPLHVIPALAVLLTALASQSVGAVILLGLGAFWLALPVSLSRLLIPALAGALALFTAVYMSGTLQDGPFARGAAIGQKIESTLKLTGRGSSTGYRVRQDQKSLGLIYAKPLTGHGTWDWWRPLGAHPWGLPLLVAGQFGVLALFLMGLAMVYGALVTIWRGSRGVLPIMVLLATADAWLNSYIFFPAIIAAGILASPLVGTSRKRSHPDAAPDNELLKAA